MIKYRAIVCFDLDGTLLTPSKHIKQSAYNAIQDLKKKHILPVISTGRNLSMIKDIMKASTISTVICDNGSYIQYHGEALNQLPLQRASLNKLVELANSLNEPLAFQTNNHIVLNGTNHLTKIEYKRHHMNPPINKDFYLKHTILFANIFTLKNDKKYQNAFKNKLTIVRNSDVCLDVSAKNVNKGLGIQILKQKLNLEKVPTYAFGDGLNDLDMFKVATHGISMKNGKSLDHQKADFITDTNFNDGIAKGLKHYHLI